MTNDYLRCSKDFEYCRDWYLEKNKGTWNQTIVKESTPSWVVKDMVDLLPEDSFTLDAKFIDIFSKSGIFLEVIRNKLMRNQAHIDKFPDPKERFNYITRNQLYALVWCDGVEDVVENQLALTTVAIYGRLVDNPNVYRVEIDRKTLKKEEGVHKFIELFYSEEYFKGMKFDVVIGNPPYNNDMYLDFVRLGHDLSTKNSVWITPAKWQAKGGQKNEDFRKDIVPHMSKIVYYRDPLDIFLNAPMCGDAISYYMIGKDTYDDKYINGTIVHCWEPRYGLDNTCINIVRRITGSQIINSSDNSVIPAKSYFTSANFGDVTEDIESKYSMRSSARCIKVPERVFKHTEDMDKYKVYIGHFITKNPVLHLVDPFIADVREDCLLGFGSKEKCKSIISYYNCKLIWFLVFTTNCGNASKEAFINVPDPGEFDHEFTDKELYDKYNLTTEEIKIIESVIKERK